MTQDKETFVRRWSRLKHQSEKSEPAPKPAETEKPAAPLPPVETLTPESDFAPFMQPKVEDALRRVALKKLFSDPHFNLPDPYEAYSGDWTVGEPIPQEMLATLNQAQRHLFSENESKEQGNEKAAEPAAQAESKTEPKPPDEPGKQDA